MNRSMTDRDLARRGLLGSLAALLLGLALWRRGRRRGLRRSSSAVPGSHARRFRVGGRTVYIREDHFSDGVFSRLRVNGRDA